MVGSIGGAVTDTFGNPIGNATLTLTSGQTQFTTTTNSNGFYTFGNLGVGTYQVSLTVPTGYVLDGSQPSAEAFTATGANVYTTNFKVATTSATQLVVTQSPTSNVQTGATFSVTVQGENPLGTLAQNFAGSVTVSIASGPAGATLGGTTTVAAVNGVATFNNLTVSGEGSITLSFVSAGLTTTTTVNVVGSTAATQLVVTTPAPSATFANTAFGFVVQGQNSLGTLDATFAGSVSVAIFSGPAGAILAARLR